MSACIVVDIGNTSTAIGRYEDGAVSAIGAVRGGMASRPENVDAALQAAGTTDSAAVMAVLPSIELDGASGHIVFDENGDAVRNSAFVKKANTATGDWEFVTEQTVE